MDTPRTRYAKTVDGVHIAYQVRGDGPVDLIYVTGWTANLEVDLEGPRSGRLVRRARLVLALDPVRQARDRVVGPDPDAGPRDARRRSASGARRRGLGASGRDGRRRRRSARGVLRGDAPGARAGADPQRRVRARRMGTRLPDRAEGGGIPRRARGHGETMGHDRVRAGVGRSPGALALPRHRVRRVVREDHPARRLSRGRARVQGHVVRDRRPLGARKRAGADARARHHRIGRSGSPTRARGGRTVPRRADPRREVRRAARSRDLIIEHTNPGLLLDEIERFVRSVSAEEARDRPGARDRPVHRHRRLDREGVELGDTRVARSAASDTTRWSGR